MTQSEYEDYFVLTWYEGNLADQHPLVGEEELHHDILAVLPVQVDADITRVLHHPVGHVDVVNSTVISEFSLLVGKINLQGPFIIPINLPTFSLSYFVLWYYELILFLIKVDCLGNKLTFLGTRKYLDIFCVVIVNVNKDLVKFSDSQKSKINLQRTHALILPSDPLVAWKWNTSLIQTFSIRKFQIWCYIFYHDQIFPFKIKSV